MPDPVGQAPAQSSQPIDVEPVYVSGDARTPASVAESAKPPLMDTAIGCLPKVDGAALALMSVTAASPLVGVLGAFKAGLELGQCMRRQENAAVEPALIRQALERCAADGGTAVRTVEGKLTCEVEEPAP